MAMSVVLFLDNIALENPKRGTPLHIERLLRELQAHHHMIICTQSVSESLLNTFVPYPTARGLGKLFALVAIMRKYRPDYILTAGQTALLAPVILKYVCGVKIAVELHGAEAETFYSTGRIKRVRYWYMLCKVWLLLHFYDVVFASSKRFAKRYAPMSDTWITVYGGVDIDAVPQVSHYETSKLVVGYMGNTRTYQGLPYLIDAVHALRTEGMNVRLHLILSGDDTDVREQLAQRGLLEVTTLKHDISQAEAHREILHASVLVIPRPNVVAAEYGFPSKLPEYLATGLPVILTDVGPVEELRPEIDRCCIVIDTDDIVHNLVDALRRVSRMRPEEMRERGELARAYARTFSWDAIARIVSDAIR
jgi:glycosyltransferase involved in cell wall biosynthesis